MRALTRLSRALCLLAALLPTGAGCAPRVASVPTVFAADQRPSDADRAFRDRLGNVQVAGEGVVVKVLKDDTEGSRHQRFILRLPSSLTLLMAHNVDLAPRVQGLREGDAVAFFGEYEWNAKGGVVHWTHHDPRGKHPSGWLKHRGKTYQ